MSDLACCARCGAWCDTCARSCDSDLDKKKKDVLNIIGAAHEALSHHDYDDPEHTITMHTKDLPDAYREACKAIGAATRILAVEDVGGGTLADRGLVRLEDVVKFLRERKAKFPLNKNLQKLETAIVQEIAYQLEVGALTK